MSFAEKLISTKFSIFINEKRRARTCLVFCLMDLCEQQLVYQIDWNFAMGVNGHVLHALKRGDLGALYSSSVVPDAAPGASLSKRKAEFG